MANFIVIRLVVNTDYSLMFYHYCKICNSGILKSDMGDILYDWERDKNTDDGKPVYKLTFHSMKNVVNFFLQLGRVVGIDEESQNIDFTFVEN